MRTDIFMWIALAILSMLGGIFTLSIKNEQLKAENEQLKGENDQLIVGDVQE